MGAESFFDIGKGDSPQEAFNKLTEEARYLYGHGGYTGTIAEKTEFIIIDCPDNKDPQDYAEDLLEECDSRVSDKWGPAGCIKIKGNKYLFFGTASS